ncbi:MAG: hypothetical protein H6563_10965 [Lewinellaceae bacterium]|nr:hypothetical protein [Lewinellaceae bacterium]
MKDFFPFLLIIVVGFAFGCQKNHIITPPPEIPIPCHSQLELIPITDTCFEPLPIDPWGFLPAYIGQNYFYRFASFDPSSYEQFLYFHDVLYSSFSIKGANICTGEIWTIMDSIQFSTSITRLPKWSEKGWVLLVRWIGDNAFPWERGLYKIKSNGDSLKFLLNEEVDRPVWLNEGEKILCRNINTFERLILNSDGEFIKNYPLKISPVVYYDGKFAGLMHAPELRMVIAEDTVVTKQLWPVDQTNYDFNGLDWLNEDEIVWITSKGIYCGNINTEEYELVKEVCPNIYYSSISAARDGSNRLLLTRRDYLFENGITDSMSVRYNISLYDMDTGEEFYVKLGEM